MIRSNVFFRKSAALIGAVLLANLSAINTNAAPNGPPPPPERLPVYRLSSTQEKNLFDSAPVQIFFSQLDVKTAALAQVKGDIGNNSNYKDESVARGNNTSAGVYLSALADPSLDANVGTEPPTPEEIFDFKETADSIQAFATMTNGGSPFLWLQGFGKTSGFVNASWSAQFQNTTDKMQNTYMSFTLPNLIVTGETEEDGPAQWRSRLRVDVVVNGYPAWSTEALRFNDMDANIASKPYFLGKYGEDINFSDATGEAPSQRVTLFLGHFKAGQTANISLQLSGEIDLDTPCVEKSKEWFCTRANLSARSPGRTISARFLMKPTPVGPPPSTTP